MQELLYIVKSSVLQRVGEWRFSAGAVELWGVWGTI